MARVCKYLEPHFKIHKTQIRQTPTSSSRCVTLQLLVVALGQIGRRPYKEFESRLLRPTLKRFSELRAGSGRERWEKLSTERRVACIRSRQLRPSLKRLPTQ